MANANSCSRRLLEIESKLGLLDTFNDDPVYDLRILHVFGKACGVHSSQGNEEDASIYTERAIHYYQRFVDFVNANADIEKIQVRLSSVKITRGWGETIFFIFQRWWMLVWQNVNSNATLASNGLETGSRPGRHVFCSNAAAAGWHFIVVRSANYWLWRMSASATRCYVPCSGTDEKWRREEIAKTAVDLNRFILVGKW